MQLQLGLSRTCAKEREGRWTKMAWHSSLALKLSLLELSESSEQMCVMLTCTVYDIL